MAKVSPVFLRNPNHSRSCEALQSKFVSVEIGSESPLDDECDIDNLFLNSKICGSEVIFKAKGFNESNSPKCGECRNSAISSKTLLEQQNDVIYSNKKSSSGYLSAYSCNHDNVQGRNIELGTQPTVDTVNFCDIMPSISNNKLENLLFDETEFPYCLEIENENMLNCDRSDGSVFEKSNATEFMDFLLSESCDICIDNSRNANKQEVIDQANVLHVNSVDSLSNNLNDLLGVNAKDGTQPTSKHNSSDINTDNNCLSNLSASFTSDNTDSDACLSSLLRINKDDENKLLKSGRPVYSKQFSNSDSGCHSYSSSSDLCVGDCSDDSSSSQTSEEASNGYNLKDDLQSCVNNKFACESESVSLGGLAGQHFASTLKNCSNSDKNLTDSLYHDEQSKTEFHWDSPSEPLCQDFENDLCLESFLNDVTPIDSISPGYSVEKTNFALNGLLQQYIPKVHADTNSSLSSLAQNFFTDKSECEEQFDSGIDSLSSFLISDSNNSSTNVPESFNIVNQTSKSLEGNSLSSDSSLLNILKLVSVDENCHENTYFGDDGNKGENKSESLNQREVKGELISDIDLNFCVKIKTAKSAVSDKSVIQQAEQNSFEGTDSVMQKPKALLPGCFVSQSEYKTDNCNLFGKLPRINNVKESLFAKALSCKPKSSKLLIKKVLKLKCELLKSYPLHPVPDLCVNDAVINERTVVQSDKCIMSGGRYTFSPMCGVQECN